MEWNGDCLEHNAVLAKHFSNALILYSKWALIISNKKFPFSGESFARANKKGFCHVCIGVSQGKCSSVFLMLFTRPGRRNKTL